MKPLKLLCFSLFVFISSSVTAQEYYDFSDKHPDKGHFALTPIAGIISKTGGGIGILASGRLQYFLSKYFTIGGQYVHLFDTGNDDLGWIGDNAAPEQSVHLIIGGHYFPNGKRLGFHGTAGLGYILSGGDNITSYFDIGGDYKLSKFTTLQLQVMEVGWAALSIGLGIQFKF